jgi:hypothetical protein
MRQEFYYVVNCKGSERKKSDKQLVELNCRLPQSLNLPFACDAVSTTEVKLFGVEREDRKALE